MPHNLIAATLTAIDPLRLDFEVNNQPRTFLGGKSHMNEELKLDLSDLELEDIEVFVQEGSRGMPDFAASTGTNCNAPGACSCRIEST
jgi:hypothetical protein